MPVPVLDPTLSPKISPATQHFRNQKLYEEKNPWTGLEKGISSTAITLPYSSACARIRLDELWPTLFMAELLVLISPKPAKTGCFAPVQFLLTEARDRCLCWYPTCTAQYNTVNSLEVYCPIIIRIGVLA